MPEPAARTPIAFRGAGFELRTIRAVGVATFAALIALWQGLSLAGLINPLFLPSPVAILTAAGTLAAGKALWLNIWASVLRIGYGWALGTAFGIVIGVLMGISSVARSIWLPLVSALFPIPKIALLPLFILWLGIGETSKITTIALGVFFPTVISTFAGVDAVPRNLIRMGQSFGLPLASVIWRIVLPGALPGMLAGARISTSTALLLVVSAEMIGAENGIGAFVLTTGNLMLTDQLLVGVAVLSILGLLISAVLTRLERRLLRWR